MRLILMAIVAQVSISLAAQNNTQDSLALKAFWSAMDGPNWTQYDWTGPTDTWAGVSWWQGRATNLILSRAQELKGTIPKEIGMLTELTTMTLINPTINGTLPDEINNLKKLTSIYIQDRGGSNDNSDYFLPDLHGLESLQRIRLQKYNVQMNGFPDWMRDLSNLTDIQLGDVAINAPIPMWLAQKSNLEVLFLANNHLTGVLPEFSGQEGMTFFGIGGQDFELMPFPNWLENHPTLEGLYMANLNLSTRPPDQYLGQFPNLQRITFLNVNLDTDIDAFLPASLPNMIGFFISDGGLSGKLSSDVFNPEMLTSINLRNNYLTEVEDFSAFNGLNSLAMTGNQIPLEQAEVMFDSLGSKSGFSFDDQFYTNPDSLHIPKDSLQTLTAISKGEHDTYQWYKDGNALMGQTDFSLEIPWGATAMGSYHCKIYNTLLDANASTTITKVSAEVLSKNDPIYTPKMKVFPNPFYDQIMVSGGAYDRITIYDSYGHKLREEVSAKDLILSSLPTGVYIVKIDLGSKNEIHRLLKQK